MWLYRVWNVQCEIDALKETLRQAEDAAASTTTTLTGMPSSASKNPHKFDKVAEVSDEVDRLIEKKYALIAETLSVIQKVDDSRARTILIERYINCKTWGEIGQQLLITRQQVYRIKCKAEEDIAQIINGTKCYTNTVI